MTNYNKEHAYKFNFNSTAVLNLSRKNTYNVQTLQFCRSTYYIHLLVVEAICFLLSTCTSITALLRWDTINVVQLITVDP